MVLSISDKGSRIQSVLPAGPESTVSGHNRKSPELFPGALACVQAESGWVGPLDTQHLGTKTVTMHVPCVDGNLNVKVDFNH